MVMDETLLALEQFNFLLKRKVAPSVENVRREAGIPDQKDLLKPEELETDKLKLPRPSQRTTEPKDTHPWETDEGTWRGRKDPSDPNSPVVDVPMPEHAGLGRGRPHKDDTTDIPKPTKRNPSKSPVKKSLLALQQFNYLLSKQEEKDIPTRPLGKTGVQVSIFGLGGQGALESHGDADNCVKIIRRAVELGVSYMDTSPVYDESEEYYGEALGDDRKKIFLATKTDDRTRDGSMKLLEKSLKRLKTDHVDLWQLHHLENMDEAAKACGKDGALQALKEMQEQKVVRFLGITGHDHPDALLYAMLEHPFDVVLCPVNACDRNVQPAFLDTVVPLANKREMGVVGMKVFAQGHMFHKKLVSPEEALVYALSQRVATVIAGCDDVDQLEFCVEVAKRFSPANETILREIEKKTKKIARHACFYRREFGGYESRDKL